MKKVIKDLKNDFSSATGEELRLAALENLVYGFLGSILIVFIATGIDIAVLIGYLLYYFYVGKVINRPKYVTSLGKFILFPIPTSLGAFAGYKLAYLLTNIII